MTHRVPRLSRMTLSLTPFSHILPMLDCQESSPATSSCRVKSHSFTDVVTQLILPYLLVCRLPMLPEYGVRCDSWMLLGGNSEGAQDPNEGILTWIGRPKRKQNHQQIGRLDQDLTFWLSDNQRVTPFLKKVAQYYSADRTSTSTVLLAFAFVPLCSLSICWKAARQITTALINLRVYTRSLGSKEGSGSASLGHLKNVGSTPHSS